MDERELTEPWEGVLITPASISHTGVLVLAGSSGRIERDRARILAQEGMTAMSIRWFGGPGQSPGICEIPLETFVSAVDLLESTGVRRICLLGSSKGAEAALTAVHDPRVDGVVAVSPTSVVWGNVGPGRDGRQRPYRSSWTWKGQPLPFVPYDDGWTAAEAADGPVAVRGWYERSERTFADLVPAAEIPIEETGADVLLVAGGDDAMWPSLPFAERLAGRRRTAGRTARLISRAEAGHRPRLPGEGPASVSPHFRYGGDAVADAELGAAAWPHILDLLPG
ncbi:acyl-CoA thioester hydrolase/BAAT C-terminal domain-containing protein [Nonomuraea guangzhouensis]|uniref:Acyl-CoA thioester hydrolase/BAAT C-terminal domain-containing protein n=1 Tax=Nonomuraea guangzhouensis TaxID=1291555 RepID=A0ABW4GEN4_9ACTN|nr:acyl-CoA thioester hydrolase/BAAT C-terminal domain-containing protein [Nonomuraea guangzhouensis]